MTFPALFQGTEKINNEFRPYDNWFVYDGMAEVFLANSNFEKAEEYYRKAHELDKKRRYQDDSWADD